MSDLRACQTLKPKGQTCRALPTRSHLAQVGAAACSQAMSLFRNHVLPAVDSSLCVLLKWACLCCSWYDVLVADPYAHGQ